MKCNWLRSFEQELRAPISKPLIYRSSMKNLSYPMRPQSAKLLTISKKSQTKAHNNALTNKLNFEESINGHRRPLSALLVGEMRVEDKIAEVQLAYENWKIEKDRFVLCFVTLAITTAVSTAIIVLRPLLLLLLLSALIALC